LGVGGISTSESDEELSEQENSAESSEKFFRAEAIRSTNRMRRRFEIAHQLKAVPKTTATFWSAAVLRRF